MKLAAAGTLAFIAAACAPVTGATSAEAPTPPTMPVAQTDECGAARYHYLVGRAKSDIPATPIGAHWRIACTTCMVTMDFVPARLTIFYDEHTKIIKLLRCG